MSETSARASRLAFAWVSSARNGLMGGGAGGAIPAALAGAPAGTAGTTGGVAGRGAGVAGVGASGGALRKGAAGETGTAAWGVTGRGGAMNGGREPEGVA